MQASEKRPRSDEEEDAPPQPLPPLTEKRSASLLVQAMTPVSCLSLLMDASFAPGARPEKMLVPDFQMMWFKEAPKARRGGGGGDAWRNTGGGKASRDWIDGSGQLGLRKRYGKVTREALGLLRFQVHADRIPALRVLRQCAYPRAAWLFLLQLTAASRSSRCCARARAARGRRMARASCSSACSRTPGSSSATRAAARAQTRMVWASL